MSRIGKLPVKVASGVSVQVGDNFVSVKGPKGTLKQEFDATAVTIQHKDDEIAVSRKSDKKDHKAKHGLYRSLINNMVEGVSKGFVKKLEFHGVGYRATAKGQLLEMAIGYSHAVVVDIPTEVKLSAETKKGTPPIVTLESHDKQLLGQVAAAIRSLRKPEPYKGKGIRYADEYIRRKAGKSAAK